MRLFEAGPYYARVTATSGAGSRGTYLLNVSIEDSVPPEVVDVQLLPEPGGTTALR